MFSLPRWAEALTPLLPNAPLMPADPFAQGLAATTNAALPSQTDACSTTGDCAASSPSKRIQELSGVAPHHQPGSPEDSQARMNTGMTSSPANRRRISAQCPRNVFLGTRV